MSVNPRINITTVNSIDIKTACFDGVGDYDPSLQRFLGEDPIGFSSRDFNFYTYVSNDPINFIDPSGNVLVEAVSLEVGYSLLALTPAGWVALGITAVTITCATAYVYYIDKYPTPDKDDKEHTKNKRPSSKGKHEKGQKRKKQKYNDKKRNKPEWKSRK